MDRSLQSANLTTDKLHASAALEHVEAEAAEEEQHIHLPSPSLWPFILSAAILLVIVGLLALPDIPWLSIVAAPFVLLGILGWALEDPMAPRHEQFMPVLAAQGRFIRGQQVVDKNGDWIGTVDARFQRYILVDRGGLFTKPYYVPHTLIAESRDGVVHLAASEVELLNKDLDRVPDDLYEETPELGIPQVRGVPLFARGPLSPAETGHYNYGPNYPGINTDASGSYRREEVAPVPQKYVADRRRLIATSRTIPSRDISPD